MEKNWGALWGFSKKKRKGVSRGGGVKKSRKKGYELGTRSSSAKRGRTTL